MTTLSPVKDIHAASICLCLAIALTGCDAKPEGDSRLQGTWRSNKEATVAAWRRANVFPAKFIDHCEKELLGKAVLICTGDQVTTTNVSGVVETSIYRVIETGGDYAVMEGYDLVQKKPAKFTIRFVKDGYWVLSDEPIKGYFEKFDLVKR